MWPLAAVGILILLSLVIQMAELPQTSPPRFAGLQDTSPTAEQPVTDTYDAPGSLGPPANDREWGYEAGSDSRATPTAGDDEGESFGGDRAGRRPVPLAGLTEGDEEEGSGGDPRGTPDGAPAAAAAPAQSLPLATERLGAMGLVRREQFWVLPEDDDLAETLAKWDGLEDQSRQLAAKWNELGAAGGLRQPAPLVPRGSAIAAGAQARQQLPGGRELLAQAMRIHSQQILAAVEADALRESLSQAYQRLHGTVAVQNALAELDAEEHQLGPSPQFERNARRLAGAAAQVLDAPLPFYWSETERGVFYLDLILDERIAWTAPVRLKAEFNLVPAQVLAEAGIEVPAEGGRQLNIGGVRFSAPAAILPSLRLGRFVVREIPVLVLPPEIRRLEGFLSPAAFPGLELTPSTSGGTLTIQQTAVP